jgi:hypothetical protein
MALRRSAALLAGAATLLGLAPASGLREPAPLDSAGALPLLQIEGGSDVEAPGVRRALSRVLSTRVGARLRARLESGALPEPLTLVLNSRGDNLTLYRVAGSELSETIAFDPSAFPLVETETGMRAAPPETVLAHELGHAVLKLASEEQVIREVENPVRAELGLPLRTRF